MNKFGKSTKTLIVASILGVAMFGTAFAQEKVKISIGHLSTIQSPNIAGTIGELKSALEGTGKVEVTLYGSGTSFSVPNKFSELVSQGVIDMAFGAASFEPGRFPLNLLVTEPFLVRDHVAGSRAITRAVRENADLMKEYTPNHLVMVMLSSAEQLHSRKPIKSFDDIKGMRILGNSPSMLAIYREAGASTVALPLPAQYENLQKGVVDAVSSSFTSLVAFKLTEVTTDHYWFNATTPINYLVINEQKYQGAFRLM
jgi:TRAP-type C4-dicarboxylate transport system substrate-binding protein